VTIGAVARRADDDGGEWLLYRHDDQDAELWYRARPGTAAQLVHARSPLWEVLALMRRMGLSSTEGWEAA
jgi:hypothetical protein